MSENKFFRALALGALIGGAMGLFFSPDKGKKNREKVRSMVNKLSATLVKDVGKLKDLSQKEYNLVVERIVKKYSTDDLLTQETWVEIQKELQARWKDIKGGIAALKE